jgi:hypothetical protein
MLPQVLKGCEPQTFIPKELGVNLSPITGYAEAVHVFPQSRQKNDGVLTTFKQSMMFCFQILLHSPFMIIFTPHKSLQV